MCCVVAHVCLQSHFTLIGPVYVKLRFVFPQHVVGCIGPGRNAEHDELGIDPKKLWGEAKM